MHEPDDTFSRFESRFRAIEGAIPDLPFSSVRQRTSPPARAVVPTLAIGAGIILLLAVIVVPPALGPSNPSAIGGPSPTLAVSSAPSAGPRTITTTQATWMVTCNASAGADCDGAVALFSNNLARSWSMIHDESGGRLNVAPRSCPTFNGLTARGCWDVTAVLPNGPFCMVVAHAANEPRYPDYFEIGGQDGTGRAGGPPDGWPSCLPTQ